MVIDPVTGVLTAYPGGPVEILVNNLGIYEAVGFFDETDESWFRLFEINIMSGVRLSRNSATIKARSATGVTGLACARRGRLRFLPHPFAQNSPLTAPPICAILSP